MAPGTTVRKTNVGQPRGDLFQVKRGILYGLPIHLYGKQGPSYDLNDLDLTFLQLRSAVIRGDSAPGRALLPAVSPPGLHGARLGGRHPHNLIF